ncbi:hypothetical protein BDN72DRAFT_845615 [Pluteus cervinus]|uniref:Uncharacterized protein n=1 Tax=Pluteus cervinus TaxID=181527 RepID=A0ACD3AI69_9AGAR|nr:hypothetical protein BDN72DRAFT_845615 [Pluteus cervinus]
MSSQSKNSKSTQSSATSTFVPKSDKQYYDSYGGWTNFMVSHGLKPYDPDDVMEGKAILDAFKEADRYEWEEKQKEGK